MYNIYGTIIFYDKCKIKHLKLTIIILDKQVSLIFILLPKFYAVEKEIIY